MASPSTPSVSTEPLREALAKLRPQAQTVIGRFYDRLLERRPDFAKYFADTDWPRQRRMLLNALVLAVESEEEPEDVRPTIEAYGRRHDPFDLSVEDYRIFGRTLRETLADALGDDWTEDVDAAWDRAFTHLVRIMRGTNGKALELV